jgi:hypothetical protein
MAEDPCKQYLPDQSKWSHADKLERSKAKGVANATFFHTMFTHLNKLAHDLGLPDSRFLYALSAHESGWLSQENLWLNNPFGMTMGGVDNLGFDSISQAVAYWHCKYGSRVQGKSTMDLFVGGLKEAKYNPNEAYYAHDKWASQLFSVDRWSARFGYVEVKQDGVLVLLPVQDKKTADDDWTM